MSGAHYCAYMDPSGGSGADAMTLGISHRDKDGYCILDVARERRPPFSPTDVVDQYAKLMKAYHIRRCVGDHWGGEFVRQPFRERGIEYAVSEITTSDTYRDTLPLFNSGKARLYNLPRLITQLCNLERTTSRTGKDTISHPKRQHDDLANAVCGALLLAAVDNKSAWLQNLPTMIEAARVPSPYGRGRTHSMGVRVAGRSGGGAYAQKTKCFF